jgi:hypothetical protein
MDVWTATWRFSIGPWNDQKRQKMSDTWHSLVLPCHHADIIMTYVTLCMCHVPYTNVEFIRTDANVSSTTVDSSLLAGLG